VSSEDGGKSCGLKMSVSQGKRPVARKALASISPVAARLYAFPNSSPIWETVPSRPGFERSHFFNFLAVGRFQRFHESFIHVLHFVAAVRWETNDVNMILSS
jgi:hypothetical protein